MPRCLQVNVTSLSLPLFFLGLLTYFLQNGDDWLSDESIEKRIEPNKLRLVMNRRSCTDVIDDRFVCGNNPPLADYPKYSSVGTSFSDLLNYDIKVPGEHWLEGESYDAEVQMLHTHLSSQRVSSIGVPVRARMDGHNDEFQAILDQFQLVYDLDVASCAAAERDRRRAASQFRTNLMNGDVADAGSEEYSTPLEDPDLARRLQERPPRFDPYTNALLPTIYFYGYDGSTTEPPCYPLTWFVLSSPMIISFEQLNQIKYLLFTHVNADCERTSVHNADQSVARPLQTQDNDRFVMKCTVEDYVSDADKDRGGD